LDAIARSIGLPEDHLCRGCLTGEYPTPTGQELYQLTLKGGANHSAGSRSYELAATPKL
jgi:amidophosphoribosyltransferase